MCDFDREPDSWLYLLAAVVVAVAVGIFLLHPCPFLFHQR